MFQLPFGPQIMGGPPAGPVAPVELPPGFRPPGLMGGGGLPSPQAQGGMGLGGIPTVPGLGMKKPGDWQAARTAGDRDLNGYGASPEDPMSGNPNAQPVEVFNPTGAIKAAEMPGVGGIDEMGAGAPGGGFFSWLKRQFI